MSIRIINNSKPTFINIFMISHAWYSSKIILNFLLVLMWQRDLYSNRLCLYRSEPSQKLVTRTNAFPSFQISPQSFHFLYAVVDFVDYGPNHLLFCWQIPVMR